MKLSEMQIPQALFFRMGMICFSVIALANSYSLYSNWLLLNWGGRIASMGSITFNVCLILFFNWLYHQQPKVEEDDMPNQKELEDFMDGLK